jgi:hypothetical protein
MVLYDRNVQGTCIDSAFIKSLLHFMFGLFFRNYNIKFTDIDKVIFYGTIIQVAPY